MMVEALALAGAFALTAFIGAPLAAATREHRWRRFATRDASQRRQRTEVDRAFTPLDLGPDPIKWPSERTWELKSTLVRPDWPSKGWNDEHFGRHWKDHQGADVVDRGFHAMAARRFDDDDTPTSPPRTAAPEPPPSRRPLRDATSPKKRGPDRPQRGTAGSRSAPGKPPAAVEVEPAARVEPPRPVEPRAGGPTPPDEIEIEHLIGTLGLAGTVQTIMQRTGWEFREAAQYLARIRRDR